MARNLHRIVIGNGENMFFWFDNWSQLGRIHDLTGPRGVIDMGIERLATMAKVFENHRRRSHRVDYLNGIE